MILIFPVFISLILIFKQPKPFLIKQVSDVIKIEEILFIEISRKKLSMENIFDLIWNIILLFWLMLLMIISSIWLFSENTFPAFTIPISNLSLCFLIYMKIK